MVVTGNLVGQVLPALGAHLADVVEQQNAHLVTGQQRVPSPSAQATPTRSASGSVASAGRLDLLAQVDALLHGLADLGVGIRAGREVAVRVALLGNHGDVGHTHLVEDGGDRDQTGTVERGVDELERSVAICSSVRLFTDLSATAS